ncbi:MAG: hypothetical protein GY874_07510 [Desulfobacteraceae bacterium]|nr:hypothetical protein [Desulfobacteraceae bacterium]
MNEIRKLDRFLQQLEGATEKKDATCFKLKQYNEMELAYMQPRLDQAC